MFDHSIKVPRLYKTAAKIAEAVSEGKGSIKQLVYEGKHPNIKALYALVVHVFKKTDDIEKLLKKSKLLVKEPRFSPWLAKVLMTELLWGKKRLSSGAKPVKTILAYEQIFRAHLSDLDDNFQPIQADKPRYVRINTLKITLNEAIQAFMDEGWTLKRYPDSTNYLSFLEAVANLGAEEFMIDLHIPYLLIFPPKTQFYQHKAYKEGLLILQDKASCLAVHILNPKPDSVVLDMCAAPGMKTTQCAAVMGDKGKVYAVEVGEKRYQTLNKLVESSGSKCVETINADVVTITTERCPDVDYILVDPSCSGSGITDRVEIGQQKMEQRSDRIEKLAAFQIKILRHALTKFPNAKRVVYSTCSLYPEENEDVLRQVLETCLDYKLVPACQRVDDKWENFGSSEFGDIGNFSLYAKPDLDFTNGFFVAVFERLAEGERNPFLNQALYAWKMHNRAKKGKERELHEENKSAKVESNNDNRAHKDKKKRKKPKGLNDVERKEDTSEADLNNETFKTDVKTEAVEVSVYLEHTKRRKKDKRRWEVRAENLADNERNRGGNKESKGGKYRLDLQSESVVTPTELEDNLEHKQRKKKSEDMSEAKFEDKKGKRKQKTPDNEERNDERNRLSQENTESIDYQRKKSSKRKENSASTETQIAIENNFEHKKKKKKKEQCVLLEQIEKDVKKRKNCEYADAVETDFSESCKDTTKSRKKKLEKKV